MIFLQYHTTVASATIHCTSSKYFSFLVSIDEERVSTTSNYLILALENKRKTHTNHHVNEGAYDTTVALATAYCANITNTNN